MAAVGARRDGKVDVALLGHTYHGNGFGDAERGIGCHGSTLIEHHIGMDVVLAKPLHCMGCSRRGDFLAIAREEPDIARGNEALIDEVLGGLEKSRDDALGVE